MATQSLPHPVPPPIIPPALPAGTPHLNTGSSPASPSAAPSSEAAMAAGASGLAPTNLLEENLNTPLAITAPMARMPVALQVIVPVGEFRVKQLLAMTPGDVIESHWANGDDLPLSSGEVQLAWTEFEVVDSRLAVRITRLA